MTAKAHISLVACGGNTTSPSAPGVEPNPDAPVTDPDVDDDSVRSPDDAGMDDTVSSPASDGVPMEDCTPTMVIAKDRCYPTLEEACSALGCTDCSQQETAPATAVCPD